MLYIIAMVDTNSNLTVHLFASSKQHYRDARAYKLMNGFGCRFTGPGGSGRACTGRDCFGLSKWGTIVDVYIRPSLAVASGDAHSNFSMISCLVCLGEFLRS